ncbi:hypothetical protein CO015_03585 [candidate division WWE3 bacterium CG_4_8_14_3_um_filter_42_11]|uniref:Uncharacterized protein n=1 Tax=candidate division WWE3 bacterium CG_4_8_14_3_um_filter_42_11 TaxID=1975076 RepID=A0A2M8G6I1_UNCKA|nr:MAG: hypothetical protein CO015_03585 [candidate division WWE3 bacterium CG_4_8_14_3_um_filter_42_11]
MSTKRKKAKTSYAKVVIHKGKLFRFLLPFVLILLTVLILCLFQNIAIQPGSSPSPFQSWFGIKPSSTEINETTDLSQPWSENPQATQSAETSTSSLPQWNEVPPDFMVSDETTTVLFSELEQQIAAMEKLEIPVALVQKLQSAALADFERGDGDAARQKILWTLQLTRELISLKTEPQLPTP